MADNTLEKAFERAISIAQRDDLSDRLPHLAITIACANTARPGPLRDRLLQTVIDQITTYDASRAAMPFLPRLQQPTGTLRIATEKTRGIPVLLDPVDLASHTLISGTTGSAKTTMAKHLVTGVQGADPTVNVHYIDPNKDFPSFAVRDERCLILTDETPLCITACPSFLRQDYYDQVLAKTFADAFYGASHTTRLLTETIREVRAATPRGYSLKDLRDTIEATTTKQLSFQERDTRASVTGRFDQIAATLPGTYHATPERSITLEHLCNRPTWRTIRSRTSSDEFLIALWIHILIEHHRHHKLSGLRTLIVMDEGLTLWQAENKTHISGSPLLDHAVSQTRSKGIGFLITTTSTREVSPMIRANTNLQISMRLVDGSEVEDARRTFRLTPDQATYLHSSMERGECLLRQSNKYPEALLCTFPKIDETPITKAAGKAALARITALLPPEPVTASSTTEPKEPPLPAPPPDKPMVIALNNVEKRMLDYVGNTVIATVSETYTAIKIAEGRGNAAKKKNIALGYLTATDITVHERRGGLAVGLELTALGYERISMKPPRRSRGGKAQSEYILQRLLKLLPGSHLELDLDGKAPDLLVRIDSVQHRDFLLTLNDHGHAFNHDTPKIPHNTLLAIEVEVSDYTKTIKNNLVKDRAAGLQHLLFAVMPKDFKNVIQHLLSIEENLDGIIVINALRLLDTLRKDASNG